MSHWSVYDGAGALKAARTLELIAQRTAHWPAHDAPRHRDPQTVAADLGLTVDTARGRMARFGGRHPTADRRPPAHPGMP
ncbi:hypothetical protein [Streptomyces sp. NPDC093093]|uniref:hypothetical protein n=1 Tax=Streptomyces sp. NPDC093093 TaxID=3366025 RepID=UPI003807BBE7